MFRERLSRAVSGVFFFEGPSRVRAAGPAVGERMCVRRMRWPRPRGLRRKGRKVRNVCRVRFAAEGVSDVVPAIPPPIARALGRRSPERQIGFAEPWRYECCGCFVPKKFPFGGRVSGHRRLFRRQRAERQRFVLSGVRAGESPCGAETSHARSSAGAENENAAGKAGCRRGRRGCRAALLPPALLSDSVGKPARRLRLSRAGRPK